MPRMGRKPIWEGIPCLRPGCGAPAKCRGLCRRCYGCANWLVQWGYATWEDLERNGKLTAARWRSGSGNQPKTRTGRNAHIKAWLLGQEEETDETTTGNG